MALTPYANKSELAAFWRPLTTDEQGRADILLELASNRLRLIGVDSGLDIDAKVETDEAYKTTIRWVVMEAVKRALQSPTDQQPVESYAQTAGPYSENYKYTNPSGDLWFKKAELLAIGLTGQQSLSSISSTRADLYS